MADVAGRNSPSRERKHGFFNSETFMYISALQLCEHSSVISKAKVYFPALVKLLWYRVPKCIIRV